MNYLKSTDYYEDLYDLHTIEECLKWYSDMRNGLEKHRDELKQKEPHVDFDKEVHKCCSYLVNTLSIERYRHKKTTISEWIEADKVLQDFYDHAIPPQVICEKCSSETKVIDKTLHDILSKSPKVSFIFECITCKKRQIFYHDGSPWDYVNPKCPKCNSELATKYKKKKDILTTSTLCTQCTYKEVEVIDFKKNKLEREKEDARKSFLLSKYRSEFCLNDSEGPQAVANADSISALIKKWKEDEIKERNPLYQKAKKINKLKVNELKELLNKTLSPLGYTDLQFGAPEMGKHVIITFTATDNINRKEYDSTHTLRKTINDTFINTNWRLMSEGISYRLGIVSGRIKAYELEDELITLVSQDRSV